MRRVPHYKSLDRGPLSFSSRIRKEEGEALRIARRQFTTITPTTPIKRASEIMVSKKERRLPVAEPGSMKLYGVLRSRDIVDFLGGGEKHRIIQARFGGNFLSAVNEPVRMILSERFPFAGPEMSLQEVVRLLLSEGVGGVPVVDDGKILGMIAERDLISHITPSTGKKVSYHMSRHVVTVAPSDTVLDASKRMVRMGFRRLPVVMDKKLLGIVTTMDVLGYLGSSRVFERMQSRGMEEAMEAPVEDIMKRDVVVVGPDTDVGEAAALMRERGLGGIPVLSGGELQGIITEHDLLRLLI
ncbi:MAG: CBS domain-containing protein [Candidatus Hadarchaeales archaeon]